MAAQAEQTWREKWQCKTSTIESDFFYTEILKVILSPGGQLHAFSPSENRSCLEALSLAQQPLFHVIVVGRCKLHPLHLLKLL